MHWRHGLFMLWIKLSYTEIEIEDQKWNKPFPFSCNDLERGLKVTTCQPRQSQRYSIIFRFGDWAGYLFQTVTFRIALNNRSSMRLCITIHQIEIVTNSNRKRADIWIKDLIPISHINQNSSMEHMQVQCDHRMRSLPKPWFHHLYKGLTQT